MPTNDGTWVPGAGGFDWHQGVFGVFFQQPDPPGHEYFYAEIACQAR